jgi:hypothetical protein
MKRKEILEAGYGRDVDWGSMSKRDFKRREMEHELGHEDEWNRRQAEKPVLIGMYFYDVPPGKEAEAASYGIKQTKNGKFALKAYDKSGRTFSFNKELADRAFGPGKHWKPKNETMSVEEGSSDFSYEDHLLSQVKKAGHYLVKDGAVVKGPIHNSVDLRKVSQKYNVDVYALDPVDGVVEIIAGQKPNDIEEGFSSEKRERLDDLISQFENSVDPSVDDYDNEYGNPDDIIDQIRTEFGDKIADQVEAGARKMHFPRDNHTHGYDPLSWKKPVDRQTKAGKLYKQDSDFRKNIIKSRYKNRGRSSTTESSGRERYEEMKDRIASVLIKLYHQGEDSESMQGFKDRVAKHLGYDPEDSIYNDAWFTSLTDASVNGDFDDDEDNFDYTDYSMRKGEMGENSINAKVTDFKPGQTATISAPTGQPGVTDTKTIDLKQNPTALTKDPQTGKLKLTLDPSKDAATTAPQQQDVPKSGDDVEIDDIKKLSGL